MPTQGRLLTLASLGALAALTAGGGVWSALTGPPIAVVQLHDAADNTIAVASAEASLDATINLSLSGALAAQGGSDVIREAGVYQAPDRAFVSGSLVETTSGVSKRTQTRFTQIGSSCWGVATCQSISSNRTNDIDRQLDAARSVSYRGGTYYLSPTDSIRMVKNEFPGLTLGLGIPAQANAIVKVRIEGSYISWVQVTFDGSHTSGALGGPQSVSARLDLDVVARYSDIDSAPPVVQPAGPPTSRVGESNAV